MTTTCIAALSIANPNQCQWRTHLLQSHTFLQWIFHNLCEVLIAEWSFLQTLCNLCIKIHVRSGMDQDTVRLVSHDALKSKHSCFCIKIVCSYLPKSSVPIYEATCSKTSKGRTSMFLLMLTQRSPTPKPYHSKFNQHISPLRCFVVAQSRFVQKYLSSHMFAQFGVRCRTGSDFITATALIAETQDRSTVSTEKTQFLAEVSELGQELWVGLVLNCVRFCFYSTQLSKYRIN